MLFELPPLMDYADEPNISYWGLGCPVLLPWIIGMMLPEF